PYEWQIVEGLAILPCATAFIRSRMPDMRYVRWLDKMFMLLVLVPHADAARPQMALVGMEEEWKYTAAVHATSGGGRHWFPCNVICGCGSKPDEFALHYDNIAREVDEASFLDGAHFYKHAQHSQAEVEERARSAASGHSQGVAAAHKEENATHWSGSFLEKARLYSHLGLTGGGQLQSQAMRKVRWTIGAWLWRIWYFVFYLAVACVCALAVIVCMADKQREGAGCIETACSACCCSTCLFLLAMFFFSLTMTAGRYLATWCTCNCT
ncbi:unnamed protein product, partial [Symbiodinium pilosum]